MKLPEVLECWNHTQMVTMLSATGVWIIIADNCKYETLSKSFQIVVIVCVCVCVCVCVSEWERERERARASMHACTLLEFIATTVNVDRCWHTLLPQWPQIALQQWSHHIPTVTWVALLMWMTWCSMKNTFGISAYSKEHTFSIFYDLLPRSEEEGK
jgi:hypothetical protein